MKSSTLRAPDGDVDTTATRELRLGRFGRHLVPLRDPGVLGFFLDNLYLAHNRGERLRRPILSASLPALTAALAAEETLTVEVDASGVPRGRAASATPGPGDAGDDAVETELATLAAGLAVAGGEAGATTSLAADLSLEPPVRWIFRGDYPGRGHRRALLIVFDAHDDRPRAVVKLGRDEPALGAEAEALRHCRKRLPGELRATLPRPLARSRVDGLEVVALSWRPGRSAYHDLYRDLSPGRRTAEHFEAAARWLADFQRATGPPPDMPVAGHGDFWAGNLLLDPAAGVTVVDWEGYTPAAVSPLDDLFQFPFTYGLHYPWEGFRRAAPEEAFARTFLQETGLARHVRRYLGTYCRRTGLQLATLREGLADWLVRRGCEARQSSRTTPGKEPGPTPGGDRATTGERGIPWDRLQARLARADRSVFSG